MKIIANPSRNFSDRRKGAKITSIVLHYTGMVSLEAAVNRMKNPDFEVSCHYCVDVDGSIYQLVDEKYKAWHAGVSYWRGHEQLNETSIGIEIVNPGHQHGYEEFPADQIKAVIELCKDIMQRNNSVDQRNITGHSDIAPERKEDPGEFFPWEELAENNIGLFHTIDYGQNFHYREPNFKQEEESKEIGEIQRKLGVIGYKIQRSTIFDEQTAKVITAFYRRFLPERILACENTRHPENIRWDALASVILDDLVQRFS